MSSISQQIQKLMNSLQKMKSKSIPCLPPDKRDPPLPRTIAKPHLLLRVSPSFPHHHRIHDHHHRPKSRQKQTTCNCTRIHQHLRREAPSFRKLKHFTGQQSRQAHIPFSYVFSLIVHTHSLVSTSTYVRSKAEETEGLSIREKCGCEEVGEDIRALTIYRMNDHIPSFHYHIH